MRRLFRWRNLVPLALAPIVMWAVNLVAHLVPNAWLGTIGALVMLTVLLPVIGFLLVRSMYRLVWNGDMLPPEIPAIIGFLYAQPTYMIVLKRVLEPQDPVSFAHWAVLTATVPLSTLMISTFDGTLIGVPLAVAAMVAAGMVSRRKTRPA